MARDVVLKINGEQVRLNAFVQEALVGVVRGFVEALDEVPSPVREIEITITDR
jgi:hypothetical protein